MEYVHVCTHTLYCKNVYYNHINSSSSLEGFLPRFSVRFVFHLSFLSGVVSEVSLSPR
jgi:hypothetical protein